MCLTCLNYIFCIACLKVTGLTLGHSWSISCIEQPLVLHIGLSLGASLPPIAKLLRLEPNPDNGVTNSERLNLAAFEQIKFCKVDGWCICWIYPDNRLMPLPNVDRTSLLNQANIAPPLMTILTCMLPFSQFKRSKLLYELM